MVNVNTTQQQELCKHKQYPMNCALCLESLTKKKCVSFLANLQMLIVVQVGYV